jgi:8-oxo-dGTP pyrophosphatase MutT (NUDIX family)
MKDMLEAMIKWSHFINENDENDIRDVVKVVLVDEEGKFLLLQRSDNLQWDLPGGRLKSKEISTPERGLQREIREETGFEIDTFSPLFFSVEARSYYRGDFPSDQPIVLSDEHVDYKMISEEDLPNYKMRDETKTAVEKALR